MMRSLREMMQPLRASPVFVLAVLLTLGLAGLNGLMVVLMNVSPDLLPGPLGQMTHFAEVSHRVHDLTFGFLFVPTIVGMLAQLQRPSKNVAGMLMALIAWVGLLLAAVLSGAFARVILFNPSPSVAMMTLIAALLHPSGRDFFRSFSVARVNWVMLALVIIAAVPLLAFASTNIQLQATVADSHAAMGHYGFMAAISFTVIAAGVLASLRPDGWRLTAWVAGLLPALLGLASLVYPDVSSSLGLSWALAAIAWGVGFVTVAERTKNVGLSADDTRVEVDRESTASTPPWLNVFGGIALVVVLGYTMLPFIGGGPGGIGGVGGHSPAQAGPGQHTGGGATPPADAGDTPSVDPDVTFTLLPIIHIGAFVDPTDVAGAEPNPTLRVPLGSVVQVTLENHGDGEYDIYFPDFEAKSERVAGGSTASIVFVADREGEFVYYSTVPGHREAGLEGRIIVGETAE